MWPAGAPRPTTARSVAESAISSPAGLIGTAGFIENVTEERKVTTLAPIHARRLAAALLLAFAALLAAPPGASAQTEVWSATLTAEDDLVGSFVGFNRVASTNAVGSLDDDNFDLAGTSFTIKRLGFNTPASAKPLQLILNTGLPAARLPDLTLHLGSDSFPLADATVGTNRDAFAWTGHGLSWSDTDTIAARLTLRTVPDAPTNLTAEAGDQQVTLNWTAPANDGGEMITRYEYEQDGSGTWTSTGSTAPTYTVRNLTNGQPYTFKVRAVNSMGESDASAESPSVTPAREPDAPTGLGATADDERVTLNWTAPASNGGAPITDYEYEQNGSGAWTSTGGTATDYTVRNLTNGQPYTFKVRAVNRVGAGAASAASPSVMPAREPNAPTGLSATADDQQVTLNWTAPASNGGATILRYEYEQDFSGTWTSTGSAATNYTVMGLTNAQFYTFRVRAVNRVGAGTASGSRSATPTATLGAPDAPHSLSATPGNRQVMLSWVQPSGGAAVTHYEYEQDFSGTWTSTGGTATSYTVRNLTNGQSYTFRVRAVNSTGANGASNSRTATPTATEPDAPQNLRSTPGDQQVTLRWTAPASDGGEPITHYEYEQDFSGTWTSTGGTATNYTVRNLTNGQSYTSRVRAVNGIGESGESNQASATPSPRPPPPPPPPPTNPDLEVQSPSVNDNSPVTGATFTLAATVRNAGDGESAATTLRFFRSEDATITTDDTAEGTDAVRRLAASATSSESIDLTAPSTAGTYYYGACVDAVTGESNTANNCSAAVEVEVEAPPPTNPDLEVQSPSVSDSSPATGATFTLSATVRNAGGGESAATTLRFFRSTNATITTADTAEGTAAVAGLAASGRYLGSVDLTAPSTAGTYYYGACVDAVPDESDITNNCSASVPVTVPEPVPALPLIGQLLLALGLLGGGGFVIGYRRPQR